MNKKLLFFDIDGTLLSEKTHKIPESTLQALKKASENGHLLFINTGRTLSTINDFILDLPISGLVCGCGTHIIYNNETLYHHTLTIERCKEVLEAVKRHNIYCIFEARDKVFFQENFIDDMVKKFYDNYNSYQFPLGWCEDEDFHGDKFCIQFHHDVEDFYKEIDMDFDIIRRKPYFSEIVPLGHSKATGIQYLADYFHVSLDDCYVFGDSFNDVPMLSYVKHSIVMKNGDPELFEMAEYVTDDVDEDGIYNAMKHYGLI